MSNPQSEIFREALELFNSHDIEKAKNFIRERFGEDADLNIIKCDMCGEVVALCSNLLATGLTGGDKLVNLQVYRHIKKYLGHMDSINGYSHGVTLPIGSTLGAAIMAQGKRFNMTLDEALVSRIEHLEKSCHILI